MATPTFSDTYLSFIIIVKPVCCYNVHNLKLLLLNITLFVGLKNSKNYPKMFKNNLKWLFLPLFITYFDILFHLIFLFIRI